MEYLNSHRLPDNTSRFIYQQTKDREYLTTT